MKHNTGNAILDKYGFYLFNGSNIKEIEKGNIWISKHNPTVVGISEEEYYNKKDFDVYVIKDDIDKKENIKPVAKGFKTRESAKKWVNKNL